MAVDGSLNFDTKIDVDGFDKGTKDISSKALKLKNKIAETEREISKLTSELNKLGNSEVKSKTVENLEKSVESAKSKLYELEGQAEDIFQKTRSDLSDIGFDDTHLDSILEQNQEWQKLQREIAQADEELQKYQRDLEQANSAERIAGSSTQEYAEKKEKLAQLNGRLNVYKSQLSETQQKEKSSSRQMSINTDVVKKFGKAVQRIGNKVKQVFGNTVVKGIKSLGRHLKNLFSHTKKTNNQMNGLAKSLRRIKQAIGGMLLYKVIQGGVEALKESLQEMAKASPYVNKQLSALKTSFTYLKNSLASAFLPILTVVTPILVRFMDTLSQVIGKIGEFVSALTGKSTYVKAIKVQQDYAESVEDSTKAIKENEKALAGYDELNVMQDTSTSNTDDQKQLYETITTPFSNFADELKKAFEKGDYGEIARILSRKLNTVLSKINWQQIRSKAKKIASNIANFINGALEEINWFLLGTTLGNGFMTLIDFAFTFVTRVKWKTLGESIAKFLNGVIKSIDFKKIGKLLGKVINSIFQTALGFAKTFDWTNLGQSLRDALKKLFDTVDVHLVIESVTSLINGIFLSAITFLGDPDFSELGSKTAKALKEMINNIDWETISKLFFGLVNGIFDFVTGFILEIDWEAVGKALVDSFKSFFDKSKGSGYKFIKAISDAFWGLLWGAITSLDELVKNMDWDKFGDNLLESVKTALQKGGELLVKLASIASKICNEMLKQIDKVFTDKETSNSVSNSINKMFDNVDWAEIVVNALTLIVDAFSWLVDTVGDIVEDLSKELADGFSHNTNNPEIEQAVIQLAKAIANLFISILNLAIKLLVNVIPNLVLGLFRTIIEILNYIGSWFMGEEWYNQNEESLKNNFPVMDFDWAIPKLATGTVVPANYGEFTAILGDNKREPEVVSPLSTMKQALKEALEENGGSGDGDIVLTINLDGEVVYKSVVKHNDRQKIRYGKSALA